MILQNKTGFLSYIRLPVWQKALNRTPETSLQNYTLDLISLQLNNFPNITEISPSLVAEALLLHKSGWKHFSISSASEGHFEESTFDNYTLSFKD
jgi:hypothetical protein